MADSAEFRQGIEGSCSRTWATGLARSILLRKVRFRPIFGFLAGPTRRQTGRGPEHIGGDGLRRSARCELAHPTRMVLYPLLGVDY